MFEILINFYFMCVLINMIICLSIYLSLELYKDWYRNRQDFYFILFLGFILIFVPIINTLALMFILYLQIFIPLIEKIFNCKYNYTNKKFNKKQKQSNEL